MPAFTLSRRRALLGVACALAALLIGSRVLGSPRPAVDSASPPFPTPIEAAPAASPTEVVVDVVGAVRRPGVYRLRSGSRVADAIAKAGGPTARADPAPVNRAAPLVDGQQLLIPARSRLRPAPGPGPPAPSAPLSLSSATPEELDTLPGIGPVTAQKIVAYREQNGPFTSVDELDAIAGIGSKRLESLRGLVVP
jgi:competence protein ComEA